jgi:hypothetical protein
MRKSSSGIYGKSSVLAAVFLTGALLAGTIGFAQSGGLSIVNASISGTTVTINGQFSGLGYLPAVVVINGTMLTSVMVNPSKTQIIATLAGPLPPGSYHLTVYAGSTKGASASLDVSVVGGALPSTAFVFMSTIAIPSSTGSFFSPLSGFGDPTGQNFVAGNGDGFVAGAAPMPVACTFDTLWVSATTMGVSFPYTFTLWKNDAPTSLSCALTTDAGTNTVKCSDTSPLDEVMVLAGDMVAIKVVQTGYTCCTPAGNFGISLHCK